MNHKYLLAILFLLYAFVVSAQPGGGGDPGPGEPVPVTGIEFLLAAGASLGIKKWLDRAKKD